jgi:3-dehydroquinate dehydratase II
MPGTLYVINGPNLNLLGTREPEKYGRSTLADVEALCRAAAARHGLTLEFRQSNHEGDIVDWFHEAARAGAVGVVINPAAYTHTSVAIFDAIHGTSLPTIEVHITNIHAREPWRQHSYVSLAAKGVICGFGIAGYGLAIDGLAALLAQPSGAQR